MERCFAEGIRQKVDVGNRRVWGFVKQATKLQVATMELGIDPGI